MKLGITRRRAVATVAAAGLALGAWGAGGSAQAGHCSQMYMFSGHQVDDTKGQWTNPGAVGCLFVNYEDENVDTNWFVPGANGFQIALRADPYGVDAAPADGDVVEAGEAVVTYDDAAGVRHTFTEPLTLTWAGTTWRSQNVVVEGLLVRVTGTVKTQTGVDTSVTYRAVGEDS